MNETEGASIVQQLQAAGIMTGERKFDAEFTQSAVVAAAITAEQREAQKARSAQVQAQAQATFVPTGIAATTPIATTVATTRASRLPAPKRMENYSFDYVSLSRDPRIEGHEQLLASINFGRGSSNVRGKAVETVNDLAVASSADYSVETAKVAEVLGNAAGGMTASKLQAAFIQPVANAVGSGLVDITHSAMKAHNESVRARLMSQGGLKITRQALGVAAGDHLNEPLTEADKAIQKELEEIDRRSNPVPDSISGTERAERKATKARGLAAATSTSLPGFIATGGESMGEVITGPALVPYLSDEQLREQYNHNILKPDLLLDEYQKLVRQEFNSRFKHQIWSKQKEAIGTFLDFASGGEAIKYALKETTGEQIGSISGEPSAHIGSRLMAGNIPVLKPNNRSSSAGDLAVARGKEPTTEANSTGKVRLLNYNELQEYYRTGKRPETPKAPSQNLKALDIATPGGAIRADSIPSSSKLEYLGPGRIKFDDVEFRAVRDLGHLSDSDLKKIAKTGRAPNDLSKQKLHGHHHMQQFHREPGAFIVEIPENRHSINNQIQHPLGNKGGLTTEQRKDWNKLREEYWKERATVELKRRELNDSK